MGVELVQTKRYGKVYTIRYHDAHGKYVRETLGPALAGWTRAKAERVLQERRVAVSNGYKAPAPKSFLDVANGWLEDTARSRRWAPATIAAHSGSLRLLHSFHTTRLSRLHAEDIDNWANDALAVYSPKTISEALSVMRQALDYAIRKGWIQVNPARAVRNPKLSKRRWRILTPPEIQKIAQNFGDDQHKLMFWVLVLTALRRHELLNLRWDDLDLERGVLRVTGSKTPEGERSVALPPGLVTGLHEWRQAHRLDDGEDYVFKAPAARYKTSRADGRISLEKNYTASFRDALAKAGITDYVRPFHDLRHTSLTNSAALEASPIALMTKAGHTDMKVTRQYLHLAGIVFPEEANQLERRLLHARNDPEE